MDADGRTDATWRRADDRPHDTKGHAMVAWMPELGAEATAPTHVPTAVPVHRLGIDGLPVPRLRGRLHEATVVPMILAGLVAAIAAPDRVGTVAVVIFTLGTVAMLTASAAYHRHTHTFEQKLSMRRIDHAMIYVAIGGSQTAYWLVVAPPLVAVVAIVLVWVVAAAGIHHKLHRLTLTRSSGSWLYIVLGWTGATLTPFLVAADDAVAFAAVLAGGLVYTAGGAVLARRSFDPWPSVFGYHEVWHTMVVLGVAAHFAGLARYAGVV